MPAKSQQPVSVFYKEWELGNFMMDIVVNDVVVVELKSVSTIGIAHENQLQNYLRATKFEVGLLLNFGPKPEIVRKVFTNDRKKFR